MTGSEKTNVNKKNYQPPVKKELLSRGAEAEIWRGEWFKRDIVIKRRIKKGYRLPSLDKKLRKKRVKNEARLMREARKRGVPVPIIYDLKLKETTLVLEYFRGERVMDAVKSGMDIKLEKIGDYIGRLHSAGITHGDLTTSNILYNGEKESFCFIDFSLGEMTSSIETIGVDIHLMREALVSVHDDPLDLYNEILSGYRDSFSKADRAIDKVKNIEKRGRYK